MSSENIHQIISLKILQNVRIVQICDHRLIIAKTFEETQTTCLLGFFKARFMPKLCINVESIWDNCLNKWEEKA